MPIYMIMPRYSHNYALSINCSRVICSPTVILIISWEKPLVKPMAPGSIFHHINLPLFPLPFILQSLLSIYIIKIPKILILLLSSLSDLTLASGREGIDNPFIVLVARFLFVCVGTSDLHVVSYWIDTLVLKIWEKYLRYFAASPFPLQGKTNACSRGSNPPRRSSGTLLHTFADVWDNHH